MFLWENKEEILRNYWENGTRFGKFYVNIVSKFTIYNRTWRVADWPDFSKKKIRVPTFIK